MAADDGADGESLLSQADPHAPVIEVFDGLMPH